MGAKEIRSGEELKKYLTEGVKRLRKPGLFFARRSEKYLNWLIKRKAKGELTEEEVVCCMLSVTTDYFVTMFSSMPPPLCHKALMGLLSHLDGVNVVKASELHEERSGEIC